MKFDFRADVKLIMTHQEGSTTSSIEEVRVKLTPSSKLSQRIYLDKGVPTKVGAKVLTDVLIQGLSANIHSCHHKNFRDSSEHLRYIISELERSFIQVTETGEANFEEE